MDPTADRRFRIAIHRSHRDNVVQRLLRTLSDKPIGRARPFPTVRRELRWEFARGWWVGAGLIFPAPTIAPCERSSS